VKKPAARVYLAKNMLDCQELFGRGQMNKLIPLLLLCLATAGCAHTAQGIKQDTRHDEPAVAHAIREAGNATAAASQKAAKAIEKGSGEAAKAQKKHEEKEQAEKS
jgi:predicted small secreted protein